ncbi:biopolymer transport protein ExbD [Dysgonomonadaceae bacterium PH5-43]|nr:biopolymer transport protein ExbD [Dysgonomonadaceae bacterium PH5-43]
MAEVQSNDHGEGGKNKQKKQTLRVDFTPMVDMNMLLITFFMLCSSLLTPSSLPINMPSKDKVQEGQENKVRESSAITVLLAADDEIYYYEGLPKEESYADPEFLKTNTYGDGGIRDYFINRNRVAFEEIKQLGIQKKNLEITEEEFKEKVREVQNRVLREDKIAPEVMIKPTDLSTYRNMVDILDEITIANIGTYAIVELEAGDRRLLYDKTGNAEYLTEEERVELGVETIN